MIGLGALPARIRALLYCRHCVLHRHARTNSHVVCTVELHSTTPNGLIAILPTTDFGSEASTIGSHATG